jgi:hypothetical protein
MRVNQAGVTHRCRSFGSVPAFSQRSAGDASRVSQSSASNQMISLHKGSGAIHGISETFSPSPYTGAGAFTVPITLPLGRIGFRPQLNLVYSTGRGRRTAIWEGDRAKRFDRAAAYLIGGGGKQ